MVRLSKKLLDNPNKFIFAYTRISPTELKGDNDEEKAKDAADKIRLQTDKINHYAEFRLPDYTIEWFSDVLISGAKMEEKIDITVEGNMVTETTMARKDFSRMLVEAKKRYPFAVIVTNVSRLARSTKDLISSMDFLKSHGVNLILIDQQVDTTSPYGMAFFQMLGVIAELERAMIVERTTSGKRQKQKEMEENGRSWGRPWNIVKDKTTGLKKELDIDEVKKLRDGGMSYRQLAAFFGCSVTAVVNVMKRDKEMMGLNMEEVIKLRKGGMKYRQLAEHFGCSFSVMVSAIKMAEGLPVGAEQETEGK